MFMVVKIIERIHDTLTGEIVDVERELTDEELKQRQKDEAAAEAEIATKAEAEVARQALLDKLGITADEAKLLLG